MFETPIKRTYMTVLMYYFIEVVQKENKRTLYSINNHYLSVQAWKAGRMSLRRKRDHDRSRIQYSHEAKEQRNSEL